MTPDFIRGFNAVLASTDLEDLKTYMEWRVLNMEAQLLPSKFVNEDFDFNQRILLGAKEIRPRWKRCVTLVDRDLG
jgi:endothelin-converting enzyme/putative endopeptidase